MNEFKQKTALISILGRPNAGKSTLLNQIIGQKISIVTPKVQTTRNVIKGIYTKDETQLIFLDTPGIFSPKKMLEKAMVRSAWSSISGADAICLIIDLSNDKNFDEEFEKILKHISAIKAPKLILFNKVDLIKKKHDISDKNLSIFPIEEIEEHIEHFEISDRFKSKLPLLKNSFEGAKAFFISAKSNKNIKSLLAELTKLANPSPWLYKEDEITTAPMRFLASEVTREQLFLQLSEELPYNLTVETDKWEQVNDSEAKVYQTIIVNRMAHKKIILGRQGQKIKEISTKSRLEISENLVMKIHLFLFVKVREDWDTKSGYFTNMGLEFPTG